MKLSTTSFSMGIALVIGVVAAVAAYRASASHGMFAPPTSAAVANLPKTLEGLYQRSDAEERLQAMTQEIRTEKEQREESILALQEEALETGDPNVRDQFQMERINYEAWARFASQKIDVERALSLQDLYRSIKQAIAELAEAEGYDLVLVDDSPGELSYDPDSRLSREAQIQQQMMARRVLYAGQAVDITDQLVLRMNNAYQSGTGTP